MEAGTFRAHRARELMNLECDTLSAASLLQGKRRARARWARAAIIRSAPPVGAGRGGERTRTTRRYDRRRVSTVVVVYSGV